MTHAQLVDFAARWLRGTRGCALVATERNVPQCLESPDAIGWSSRGESILVECKTSLADFRADAEKIHRITTAGMGMERWFLAEPGVIPRDLLPPGWGLVEVKSERVCRVVQAPVRSELANEIARLEQPLLVAITRRALEAASLVRGLSITDSDLEAA